MDKQHSIKIVNSGLYGKLGNGGTFTRPWATILDQYLMEERRKKLEKITNRFNGK